MSKQNWNLIRIGVGDYAKGNKGPLYKEILECAKLNKATSASVFKSIDGFLIKGSPEVVRLFGGTDKSQALIIEALIESEYKDDFLSSLHELLANIDDPVIISIADSNVEVFGIE